MFEAMSINGDIWSITETDAQGNLVETHTVAVKAGGSAEDAIAAIAEALSPPPPDPAQVRAERAQSVKVECRRRIFAVVDSTVQMNLAAMAGAGIMDTGQMKTYQAMVKWVADMRATCQRLAGDGATDYLADAAWPGAPQGSAELVAAF